MQMNKLNREKFATICLMIGTFFNPLGYDALLYQLIELTGSYWISIFYLLSVSFFILYLYFANKNSFKWIKKRKKCRYSSVGQSVSFVMRMSWVRIPLPAQKKFKRNNEKKEI